MQPPYNGPLGRIRADIAKNLDLQREFLRECSGPAVEEAAVMVSRLERLRKMADALETYLDGYLLEAVEPYLRDAVGAVLTCEDEFYEEASFMVESIWFRRKNA